MFQAQHTSSLGQRQRFTYGLDALLTRPDTDGTIMGRNESDDDLNEYGGYLQSETALSDMLDLVLALRYDYHKHVSKIPSYRLGPPLVFKPQVTQTLRLTYNRAFSTPTSNNLYPRPANGQRSLWTEPKFLAPLFGARPRRVQIDRWLDPRKLPQQLATASPSSGTRQANPYSARPLPQWPVCQPTSTCLWTTPCSPT